jgi:hypothetical protein
VEEFLLTGSLLISKIIRRKERDFGKKRERTELGKSTMVAYMKSKGFLLSYCEQHFKIEIFSL